MGDQALEGLRLAGMESCRLRLSPRARRMRLEVRPDRSLLVVVPSGTREDQWLGFVLSRRSWIERALARWPQAASRERGESMPRHIQLPATGEAFTVACRAGASPRLRATADSLQIVHRDGEADRCPQQLRTWLLRKARRVFTPWLAELASRHGLDYTALSVRGQKTRWGSCSGRGTISLNCKLLFLPPELVEHVMCHELAHTVHPNHSAAFWRLLDRLDPQCAANRRALRQAARTLPSWLGGL